mmetsp:Transcript_111273/g.175348  ORF Transcript_111273/g.175348 Transcript_111273/m.175348 type:complete len:208 (-) Transcript_111273:32-655(-)
MPSDDGPGIHAILYMSMFVWIAAQATFWLGAVQESGCPTSIVVLEGIASIGIVGLISTHILRFASFHDSKLISTKYYRERRKLRANAEIAQVILRRVLQVQYVVMVILALVLVPFLLSEGMPKSMPDDGNLSCQASWLALWVDAVGCLFIACVWVVVRWNRIETLEALFEARGACRTVAEEYTKGIQRPSVDNTNYPIERRSSFFGD